MNTIETELEGLLIIKPTVYQDKRGYFYDIYHVKQWMESKMNYTFVQSSVSLSKQNTIRGLHFQVGDHAQDKLVTLIRGRIVDVAVDIRPNSTTFGKYIAFKMSENKAKQLFIPKGFAHGFSVLSEEAIIMYNMTAVYCKEKEGGIAYDDPSLNIDWMIPVGKEIVSEKDKSLPYLKDLL